MSHLLTSCNEFAAPHQGAVDIRFIEPHSKPLFLSVSLSDRLLPLPAAVRCNREGDSR